MKFYTTLWMRTGRAVRVWEVGDGGTCLT